MKLYRLSAGVWTILAYADARDNCHVLDVIHELDDESLAQKMLTLLYDTVPAYGIKKNETFSRKLKGYKDTYEFKRGPKKGPGIRVLYFYDGRVIVCSTAFVKKGNNPDDSAIEQHQRIRVQYFQDKSNGKIEIEDIDSGNV